jgi:hypothetical protein
VLPTSTSELDPTPAAPAATFESLPDPVVEQHHGFTHHPWTSDLDDEAVVAAAAAAAAEAVDEEVGLAVTNPHPALPAPAPPRRLTKERKEKLDALGFVWSLRIKRIDDHWDEMFRQVRVAFSIVCLVDLGGDTNLPLSNSV